MKLRDAIFGLRLLAAALVLAPPVAAQVDPLPSWNAGPAKQAILDFVSAVTTEGGPEFVPAEARIATFDQDGTLWVEHPVYSQLVYILDRVPAIVEAEPELAEAEPFKTVLTGDLAAISKLPASDLEKLAAMALSGMTTDVFQAEVESWLAKARDKRWNRPYTDLIYQPMLEVMALLRDRDFKTYIVTGGGQDFVRTYSEATYGVPPEQVVGTAGGVAYSYGPDGAPILTKEPRLILNDNDAGKVEGIHLMIGRRPLAAFGNTAGDRQMLEYTKAGEGARLAMLVLHDDARGEYAYGPAEGLPDTKVGAFSQDLHDEALRNGWVVIGMKDDWNRVFAFEDKPE